MTSAKSVPVNRVNYYGGLNANRANQPSGSTDKVNKLGYPGMVRSAESLRPKQSGAVVGTKKPLDYLNNNISVKITSQPDIQKSLKLKKDNLSNEPHKFNVCLLSEGEDKPIKTAPIRSPPVESSGQSGQSAQSAQSRQSDRNINQGSLDRYRLFQVQQQSNNTKSVDAVKHPSVAEVKHPSAQRSSLMSSQRQVVAQRLADSQRVQTKKPDIYEKEDEQIIEEQQEQQEQQEQEQKQEQEQEQIVDEDGQIVDEEGNVVDKNRKKTQKKKQKN